MTGTLIETIARYRAGLVAFEAYTPKDTADGQKYAGTSYEPPLEMLKYWDQPAATMADAVEAIRIVLEEERQDEGESLTISLLAAALGFFDARSDGLPITRWAKLIDIENEINAAKYRIVAIGLMAESLRLRGVSDAITAVVLDARGRLENAADHLEQFRETAGAA